MVSRTWLAVLLLAIAPVVQAQTTKPSVPAKVGHYVKTHKRLLVADAVIVAAWSADAASSVHAQKSGCCVESNPILGPHPNEVATWSFAMGMAGLLVTGEHLIWWQGNKIDPEAGHVLIWPIPIAFGITEAINVHDNANYAGRMAQARARVSR